MRQVFFIMLGLLLAAACSTNVDTSRASVSFATSSGESEVLVEVAQTPLELQQGLMYRESLDENSGMIFLFDNDHVRTFWMKNTLIPLDMIFVHSNGTIVKIHTAQPCSADPCATYSSEEPAQYVIEVNAGHAALNNITVGSQVELNNIFK